MMTIPELKKVIVKKNNPYLQASHGRIDIEVCGNNIIKMHNKPISWLNLQSLIYNSDYVLVAGAKTASYTPGHGGRRIPGPGKKIGRPCVIDKKKPVSFTLSTGVAEAITVLANKHSLSKSEIVRIAIEMFPKEFYPKTI